MDSIYKNQIVLNIGIETYQHGSRENETFVDFENSDLDCSDTKLLALQREKTSTSLFRKVKMQFNFLLLLLPRQTNLLYLLNLLQIVQAIMQNTQNKQMKKKYQGVFVGVYKLMFLILY